MALRQGRRVMRSITTSRKRLLACFVLVSTGCGVDAPVMSDDPGTDPVKPGPTTFTEAMLTVATKLTITPGTGTDVPPVATLDITARDGMTPVITDLWLYTI